MIVRILLAVLVRLWRSAAGGERERGSHDVAASPYRAAAADAERRIRTAEAVRLGPDGASTDPTARLRVAEALVDEDDALRLLGRHEQALGCLDELLARIADAPEGELATLALRGRQLRAGRLLELERFEESVASADGVLAELQAAPESELRDELAVRVLVTRAWARHKLGDSEAALSELRAVVDRYREATLPAMEVRVATALLRIAVILDGRDDFDGADAARRDAIDRYGCCWEPRVRSVVSACLYNAARAARAAGDTARALQLLDEVVARSAAVAPPAEERVTSGAEYLRVSLLDDLGRDEEAAAARDAWIARHGDDPRPVVQDQLARMEYVRAVREPDKTRTAEQMDEWAARFDVPDTPVPRRMLVQGLTFRGAALAQAERTDDALTALAELIDRFGEDDDERTADRVLRARQMRIDILDHYDRREQAVEEARALVDRYGDRADEGVREVVLYAMRVQAAGLWHLGRPEAEIAVLRETLERFADDPGPEVHSLVLRAADRLIALLAEQETDRVVGAMQQLTVRFAAALDEPGDHSDERGALRADVLLVAAAKLVQVGRAADALPAVTEVGDRLRGTPEQRLRTLSTRGDMYRVAALMALGRADEADALAQDIDFGEDAMPILDEMADRSREGTAEDAFCQAQIPVVLGLRAQSLQKVGRTEEARAAVNDLMARYGDDPDATWEALAARAAALYDVGRLHEALSAIDELLDRFGDSSDPRLVPLLAEAREGREELVGELAEAADDRRT